jgi:hypothetical protein
MLEYDVERAQWISSHSDARIQKMAECFLESYLQQNSMRHDGPIVAKIHDPERFMTTSEDSYVRPVRDSQSEMAEIVLPNDSNVLGALPGGRLMHWIDLAAAMAAHRHSRNYGSRLPSSS